MPVIGTPEHRKDLQSVSNRQLVSIAVFNTWQALLCYVSCCLFHLYCISIVYFIYFIKRIRLPWGFVIIMLITNNVVQWFNSNQLFILFCAEIFGNDLFPVTNQRCDEFDFIMYHAAVWFIISRILYGTSVFCIFCVFCCKNWSVIF